MSEHLFSLLQDVIDRMPWHSEAQHDQARAKLRDAEAAMMPDAESVLPPAPVEPSAPVVATPDGFDYSKLAAEMLKQQQAQAAAAVEAEPEFTHPGMAVESPEVEAHAAATP